METEELIIERMSPWDFEKTIELICGAAKKRKWNMPAVHDLQHSLAKEGKDVDPVTIIEICKPEYSGQLLELSDERIASVMMPCRISVYLKDDGKTYVAMINSVILAAHMPDTVRDVMIVASDEVNEIIDSVIS